MLNEILDMIEKKNKEFFNEFSPIRVYICDDDSVWFIFEKVIF